MSACVYSITEAVQQLNRSDYMQIIDLDGQRFTYSELTELFDCLLAHPNLVSILSMSDNQLTDEMGIKIARYIATSSTILSVFLPFNLFGEATYLALADALRVNASLQNLYMSDNQMFNIKDKSRVDAAFVDALLLNPDRPIITVWYLYSWTWNDFPRLKRTAEELGHPNMQALLAFLISH